MYYPETSGNYVKKKRTSILVRTYMWYTVYDFIALKKLLCYIHLPPHASGFNSIFRSFMSSGTRRKVLFFRENPKNG